jgi:hypothetical protein
MKISGCALRELSTIQMKGRAITRLAAMRNPWTTTGFSTRRSRDQIAACPWSARAALVFTLEVMGLLLG